MAMKTPYYVIDWNYVFDHLSIFEGLSYQIWLVNFRNEVQSLKLRNIKQLRNIQKAIV